MPLPPVPVLPSKKNEYLQYAQVELPPLPPLPFGISQSSRQIVPPIPTLEELPPIPSESNQRRASAIPQQEADARSPSSDFVERPADNGVELPWCYPPKDQQDGPPLGFRMVPVDEIRFTQLQVYDTFSDKRSIMELVNGVLSEELDHRNVPPIRVAWHNGAFWSIDNRRTFVGKHLRMGRIRVEVCSWEKCHEFLMKWKNGEKRRLDLDGGKRVIMHQRNPSVALPRSPVMDDVHSQVENFMDKSAQFAHETALESFALKRSRMHVFEDFLASKIKQSGIFEVRLPAGNFSSATVGKAYPDATFDMYVHDQQQHCRLLPGVPSDKIRQSAGNITRISHLTALDYTSYVVPPGMRTRLPEPWCVLCAERVDDIEEHERKIHDSNEFRCITCNTCFPHSDRLRKHSRTKAHEIPAIFHWSSTESASPNRVMKEASRHKEAKDKKTRAKAVVILNESEERFAVAKGSPSRSSSYFRCSICDHDALDSKQLKAHETKEHAETMFSCSCGKSFQCATDLRRHSRSIQHPISTRFKIPEDAIACNDPCG